MHYLGIDGGGTKTHAVLLGEDGAMLAEGFAGGSNYHSVGAEVAARNIESATVAAFAALGTDRVPCDAAFLGMAGVVSESDRAVIAEIARRLDLAPLDRTGIDHDLRIALAGGLSGAEGIVLIAGTGSSCYGRRNDGTSWRAGGWGHVLDDGGGGYRLGLDALVAATRADDLRGVPTSMTGSLMSALGITDLRDVLTTVNTGDMKSNIAALAPIVLTAAEAGDDVAVSIVRRGADELGLMVGAVLRGLDWSQREEVPVVFVGSLLQKSKFYRMQSIRAIQDRCSNTTVVAPNATPAFGAGLLGMMLKR